MSLKNRNSEVLASFVAYCADKPDLRFWQALRNWSGHNYIWVSQNHPIDEEARMLEWLRDTFSWEGKSG